MKKKTNVEQSLMFMEQMRCLKHYKKKPKKLISLRIPESLLIILKNKAELENKKYQNLIVQSIEEFLFKTLKK
ncbi:MAG: hypothetical protein GDA46_06060 [Bdellovibrionales bacterium]|nr:hypothetical protein [Bdellovibrionales bacterium]